jgi:uncharacterized protein YggU (UPF0235/DUF167 family)
MARPRSAAPDPAALLGLVNERGLIEVRVTPNASADEIILPAHGKGDPLIVRTTATPESGKANEAVLRLLARSLNVAASSLQLVRGASGRAKVIRVARG